MPLEYSFLRDVAYLKKPSAYANHELGVTFLRKKRPYSQVCEEF